MEAQSGCLTGSRTLSWLDFKTHILIINTMILTYIYFKIIETYNLHLCTEQYLTNINHKTRLLYHCFLGEQIIGPYEAVPT